MISATDRMKRLVAAIPWIVAQDGAPLDEVAKRFDYPRDQLVGDLQEVVFFVGVPPYTPDTLIFVDIDDDMVYISYADWFSRPMKLTGSELLALLTAGETALAFDNQDEAGALARGLLKLRLSSGTGENVDVEVASSDKTYLPVLREAANARLCVDIEHYSVKTNAVTARRVEPSRFFVTEGHWYLGAFCHVANADRHFRIDRITNAVTTEVRFEHTPDGSTAPEATEHFNLDEAPRATILMPEHRRRVLDGLPIDDAVEQGDGVLSVTLPVSSERWLAQLLLRIGPGVSFVESTGMEIDIEHAGQALSLLYMDNGTGAET